MTVRSRAARTAAIADGDRIYAGCRCTVCGSVPHFARSNKCVNCVHTAAGKTIKGKRSAKEREFEAAVNKHKENIRYKKWG